MNYLLDTHVFLWVIFDDGKLSTNAKLVIRDLENTLHISAITYWEIALKYSLGKLELQGVTPAELPQHAKSIDIETLPISEDEVSTFYKLPQLPHKDPFDRLIIWQAIKRNLTLISKDKHMREYQKFGLNILW
ncbi:MAG: type II toxin-antitoxin system VapC family toxin [bacterium]|nr:type II toxin-antitoxin system VapC family toxin [bacterium]